MEDNGSIKNDLKMHPNGRNGGPMVVTVDESSKLPLFDGGGQSKDDNKQVGGNEIAIEEPREGLENDILVIESFGNERQYPTREW